MKALILDLEGVIIKIDYQKTFAKFKEYGLNVNYDKAFKLLTEAFDRGEISKTELYEKFCEQYCPNNNISFKNFTNAWNAMLLDIPDENFEYLFKLKQQGVILVLLSNINVLHAENIRTTYGPLFDLLFDATFYSYEIKALKPTAEAFEHAIRFLQEQHGIDKTQAIFIDDMKENIKAAQSLNLSTEHYPMNGIEKDKQMHLSLRGSLDKHIPLKHAPLASVFFNSIAHNTVKAEATIPFTFQTLASL